MKTRVWELAKELKISSKDLIKLAQVKNIEIKNALASIDVEEEKVLKTAFQQKLENKQKDKSHSSSQDRKTSTFQEKRKDYSSKDEKNNAPVQKPETNQPRYTKDHMPKNNENNKDQNQRSNYQGQNNQNRSNQGQGQGQTPKYYKKTNDTNKDSNQSSGQGGNNRYQGSNNRYSNQGSQNSSGQSSQGGNSRYSNQGGNSRYSNQGSQSSSGQSSQTPRYYKKTNDTNKDSNQSSGQGGSKYPRTNHTKPEKRSFDNKDSSTTSSGGNKYSKDAVKPEKRHFDSKDPKEKEVTVKPEDQKDKRRDELNKKKKFQDSKKKFQEQEKPGKTHHKQQNSYNDNYTFRGKRRKKRDRRHEKKEVQDIFLDKQVEIVTPILIKDFSQAIGVKATDIINKLFSTHGQMVTINTSLEKEAVETLSLDFNRIVKVKENKNTEETLIEELEMEDSPETLVPRGPVVTFLGHVDHGKTSLLDKIRNTNVTAKEAGGITQHIGAYKVNHKDTSIVFLDTPGHEAFTAMRARGANVTDIVVLIVAVDDGVMPQTVEAINHAKAAEVPIIVALNKIDKEGAKPEATVQQLMKYNLIPDEWGGDTVFVKVSAITGQGVEELLEYLVLVAEMQGLKANPKRKAYGTVLEAKVKEGKGTVATLLVQNGTLKKGDMILCGTGCGRIRDLSDHRGKKLKEALPATPVEISGLSELPDAGDKFYVVNNLSQAQVIAESRQKNTKEKTLKLGSRKLTVEELMKQIQDGVAKELNLILKADVQGSVEALINKLSEISHEEIKVNVLHAAVGGINETDIHLASASKAIVLGFNVTPSKAARDLADFKGVEIRRYSVIYHLLDEIKKVMTGMLSPEIHEEIIGHVLIRKVIKISRYGNIAGCYVTDGHITRNSKVRVSRDGVIVNKEKPFEISSLKHLKEDVGKVKQGFECGIRLQGFDDFKEGDEIEVFQLVEVKRKLE